MLAQRFIFKELLFLQHTTEVRLSALILGRVPHVQWPAVYNSYYSMRGVSKRMLEIASRVFIVSIAIPGHNCVHINKDQKDVGQRLVICKKILAEGFCYE